ncbi:hypothetical protein SDC9_157850 [bioreactor metagenome]|uniref:Uncharacterized protein n=1 Tax=bioreactor metagenome TaxID=1076179 RepID=A0A645F858_9ZZZZ
MHRFFRCVDQPGIAAVVLHRHVEQKHRLALLLVFKQINHFFKVGFIADTVAHKAADHFGIVERI